MQEHGVTQGELERYLEALLNDGAQLAASADSQPHSEVLDFVMESITTGQCINSNTQSYAVRCRPLLNTTLCATSTA